MENISIVHINNKMGPVLVSPSPTSRPIPFNIDIVKKCVKEILKPQNPLNVLITLESIRFYTQEGHWNKLTWLECSIREKLIFPKLINIDLIEYNRCERDQKIETILNEQTI